MGGAIPAMACDDRRTANRVVMDRRAIEFLHESNAIEDITNIDYTTAIPEMGWCGHAAAFEISQERALSRELLSANDLIQWQELITREQLEYGHPMMREGIGALRSPELPYDVYVGSHPGASYLQVPALVNALVEDLNASLFKLTDDAVDAEVAVLMGDFLQRFQAIHPFVDGNGRTGRLLANYAATWCGRPIIVVRMEDRPLFYPAHRSRLAMRIFMADKLREAVFGPGCEVFELVKGDRLSGSYANQDGTKTLIREWHELLEAQSAWLAEVKHGYERLAAGPGGAIKVRKEVN